MFALDTDRFPPLLSQLQALCTARAITIATAESCTGGLIGGLLTSLSGSSLVYRGGFVVYANEAKTSLLGVSKHALDTHGAVSEPIAISMAEAARLRLESSCALAVTGIAGPSGGRPEKPVGTVYCAWSVNGQTEAQLFQFPGDRTAVRAQACWEALDGLFQRLVHLE